MTQAAHAEHLAEIIDLDARRGKHEPRPHGWHDLAWIGGTDKRDAIRIYARLGLHPIGVHGVTASGACTCGRSECTAIGKHPTERGWQLAPFELERLDDALIENPILNVGLRMGRQPGGFSLITIDVDGGKELLEPLEHEHGALPRTLTAASGKGLHLIFRLPAGMEPPKNRVRLAPGVDVRSHGGQIVAAPSRHRLGHTYGWIDVRPPEVLPHG